MRNNPILFNDPLGDSILDKRDKATADRIVHRSNNKIAANEKNISDNNLAIQKGKAELAAGDLSEKKIKSLNKEIEKLTKENIELTSKNEYLSTGIDAIANLRTDINHNYSFESGSNDGSHYVIQGKGKNVKIQGSSDGLLLHESVHILQSARAEGLKFSQGGKLFNSSFTRVGQINNEVQSYRVQFSFDGTFIPDEPSSNLSDINSEVVGRHY